MTEGRPADLHALRPDHVFEGGDLDCGSGLALLIRQHMLEVPEDGILEIRSREATVRDDLPPWCRMTGHAYLGALDAETAGTVRYFVRRGAGAAGEDDPTLASDLDAARRYEWRVRARSTGPLRSRVYFRNFTVEVGQPASFEERDEAASAIEYLLVALGGSLNSGFANECRREGLEVDDVELAVTGRLRDVLVLLGLGSEGDPGLDSIELKCFASSLDEEARVRACWDRALQRCPVAATLRRACELTTRFAIV